MNQFLSVKDNPNRMQSALTDLRAAQELAKQRHAQGLAELNTLFRSGTIPEPTPNGRYAGELIALDIAPGFTQFFQWLLSMWMPWLGKTFNAAQESGDNIFTKDSYPLARFFNPFYRGFAADTPNTYRGFAFHTYIAPGLADPDRQVLEIDYNLKENPSLTVRRVLDELVQVDHNLYLGKAHVRWWWRPVGGWQTVAYFTLRSK
ncbi:MAG TPA: hypothetical protein VK206_27685 [Anaerolineales bacterium]|nr:hypothetical protein [Anaerolineales bacterium]